MSRINEKLGLKPATAPHPLMRNLPKRLTERAALTRLTCPACHRHDVIENVIHGRPRRMCTWCLEGWDV